MIEQWYAVHKVTGEFFCHRGRYCFSEKGLMQSIRKEWNSWRKGYHPLDWEFRKVELK
jgi:hypothetical protein